MKIFRLMFVFVLMVGNQISIAQISIQQKNEIIDSLCVKLKQYYIHQNVADSISDYLLKQKNDHAYDNLLNENSFVNQVTADLQYAGHDLHLRLEYSPSVLPPQNDDAYILTEEEKFEMRQFFLHENYGIRKVEVLKGNIGLIDFNLLCGADYAGEKYAAIMSYLSHTDALIIDLRNCRGARGTDSVTFLASYFFEDQIHLNDLIWRKDNVVEQKWTYAYMPGKRYINKPVYILTSARTFSGGEGFSYHLQALNRVTIIGEQTAGGANPGTLVRINDHFSSFIPFGITQNPITGTSWEGIGVIPDSLVKANRALYEAHTMALKYCIEHEKDTKWKKNLENIVSEAIKNPPQFSLASFKLKGYNKANNVYLTGSFNNWAKKTCPMTKHGDTWETQIECEPGEVQYRFIVDDIPILDPENKETITEKEYTNSVIKIK